VPLFKFAIDHEGDISPIEGEGLTATIEDDTLAFESDASLTGDQLTTIIDALDNPHEYPSGREASYVLVESPNVSGVWGSYKKASHALDEIWRELFL
jgi:hypothetical protein